MRKNCCKSRSGELQNIPLHSFFLSGALSTRMTPKQRRKTKGLIYISQKLYQLHVLRSTTQADL